MTGNIFDKIPIEQFYSDTAGFGLYAGSQEVTIAAGGDDQLVVYENTTGRTVYILNAAVVPVDEASVDVPAEGKFYLRNETGRYVLRDYHGLGSNGTGEAHLGPVPLPLEDGGKLQIEADNLSSTDSITLDACYTVVEP